MTPALLLAVAVGAAAPAAPQTVVLDFTASWCGPCQQMSPLVSKLQREGYPIRKVDVDQQKDLAQQYRITGIPAFIVIVNGREVGRLVGAQSESNLRQLLAKLPAPTPATQVLAEAAPTVKTVVETAATTPPSAKRQGWFPQLFGSKESPTAPEFPEEKKEGVIYRGQPPEEPTFPAAGPAPTVARDPMVSAVRLRVTSEGGNNLGSGTVIACRNGKAMILTCFHIFRGFGPSSAIEVDLFPNGPDGEPVTLQGHLIGTDDRADVGLVGIKDCGDLPVSPLAATDAFPKAGDHVFSVGCGHGKQPEKRQHSVARINPYEGPDTVECSGLPEQGRSGGGLFDTQGRVVGVCIAAVRESQRGVYAGPAEVRKLLTKAGFEALLPQTAEQLARSAEPASPFAPEGDPAAFPPTAANTPPAGRGEQFDAFAEVPPAPPSPGPAGPPSRFESPETDHAQVLAAAASGASIKCIIQKPGDPTAEPEVVVINRASPKFLRYLRGELDGMPTETAAVVRAASAETADASAPPAVRAPRPIWPAGGGARPYVRSAGSRATAG